MASARQAPCYCDGRGSAQVLTVLLAVCAGLFLVLHGPDIVLTSWHFAGAALWPALRRWVVVGGPGCGLQNTTHL